MQTVKYISPAGDELIIEALRVRSFKTTNSDRHPYKIEVIEPDGHLEIFEDGTVYVMNDAGSTTSQWMIDNKQ